MLHVLNTARQGMEEGLLDSENKFGFALIYNIH